MTTQNQDFISDGEESPTPINASPDNIKPGESEGGNEIKPKKVSDSGVDTPESDVIV